MDPLHASSLYAGPLHNSHLTNIDQTLHVTASETLIVNTYSRMCFYYNCGKGYKHPHKISSVYSEVIIAEIIYCAKIVLRA